MNKSNDNEKEQEMKFKLLNGKNFPYQKVYSVQEISDSYIDNNSPKPLYYEKKKILQMRNYILKVIYLMLVLK